MGEEQQSAVRDWHTRALVRITKATETGSVDPRSVRRWRVGEECVMLQWGNAGRPVERDAWWDSFDIDGAHIIRSEYVEVVNVLDEISPF